MDARHLLDDKGGTVITVRSDQSVRDAVHALTAHNIGALPVLDPDGRLTGIVSERDITRGLDADGPGFIDKRIDELPKITVISCEPDESIVEIISLMRTYHIRHMPVVDGVTLIGMISIRDVLDAWMSAMEEIHRLREAVAA